MNVGFNNLAIHQLGFDHLAPNPIGFDALTFVQVSSPAIAVDFGNMLLSARNGLEQVAINPEWDFKFTHRKIESAHRMLSGGQYRYVWGVYYGAKFRLEFVSSSAASMINNWHGSGSPVMLRNEGVTTILSGYLSNATKPIDQYLKPFTDQRMGMIELEGNTPYNAVKVPANIVC